MNYHNLNSIGAVIEKMLKKNKLEQGIHQIEIKNAWRNVMGEGAWTYTTNVKFAKNLLTISLLSSTLRQEYTYRKDEIIKMLNIELNQDLIKSIRFL